MHVTYQSRTYKPGLVLKRYVRFDGKVFRFCEVGEDWRYDIRLGFYEGAETRKIPAAIRAEAKRLQGYLPGYVEWPL